MIKLLVTFSLLLGPFASLYSQEPSTFKNPILPGFHPDPSICRVGEDYYLINSSFEWFPGVPIYHSKDLVNWSQIGNILDRPSQLMMKSDMKHNQGIWAPTLRYHDGLFYMITTAQSSGGNFFVTAKNPEGPWSEPIWIKDANGIDPSLYWDENGDCWYSGAGRMGDPNWKNENRIYIAKLDLETGNFLTPKKQVTSGHAHNAMFTEGPHLYKFGHKYVLIVAEGGTGSMHAITVHESDTINGVYEAAMINPVMTHRHLGREHAINTIGHTDLVQTQNGDWWAVMLGKRPNNGHMLARETFLTPVTIENNLPIFNKGKGQVLVQDQRPNLPWSPVDSPYERDHFNGDKLGFEYCCVRTPIDLWWKVVDGTLVLNYNKESFTDFGNPSFWARRIDAHDFKSELALKTKRMRSNEEAGLLVYRTNESFLSLMKTKGAVKLSKKVKGHNKEEVSVIPYKADNVIFKFIAVDGEIQAYYGLTEHQLLPIGEPQEINLLGDDVNGGFNGPFVGLASSANGIDSKNIAVFDWFEYTPLNDEL